MYGLKFLTSFFKSCTVGVMFIVGDAVSPLMTSVEIHHLNDTDMGSHKLLSWLLSE